MLTFIIYTNKWNQITSPKHELNLYSLMAEIMSQKRIKELRKGCRLFLAAKTDLCTSFSVVLKPIFDSPDEGSSRTGFLSIPCGFHPSSALALINAHCVS